ncbi:TonB-dependent hemoglobin/transferrin/lactoferrin family receptor [Afipia carboxidovorans]|uniref:TonB-dependent hemoglobin/transferrin/lactoferrin family receptor n=1 Tax=Afipia carboxidovorans TaxID=40137 RepID=UPI0030891761|nr:TonB-dependent hemoglobin/transferrin/lactoferrin family receptor [Afipia carboxidovorans]
MAIVTSSALAWGVSLAALSLGGAISAHAEDQVAPVTVSQAASSNQNSAASAKRQKPQAAAMSPEVRDARAQAVDPRVPQPLDMITVTASKTEERAVDALAPVSVVTPEQIEVMQASTIGNLIYNIPGVWTQDRGDEPSTSINIRGLQDFGRVAFIVDGARQNYQRTGHFANGSFFLNPELISSIDIVRGPTANIYGSGAIGGVASFRTKDIDDVVRAGERWGVDMHTVIGSNHGRALGSIFAGARINPNVDIFAGGTYSTQDNYRDGTGYQIPNTWNRLSSGIAKLTVRPADGHEVKLGTIYQENIYNVGQPARKAGDPNSTNPNGSNNLTGTSIYATNVKNYTTTLGWTYSQPDDQLFDWNARIYWNRTENDQIKVAHNTGGSSGGCAGVAPGTDITGCVGDPRSYQIDTYGFDAYNTSRIESGEWRHAFTYGADGFRDRVSTYDKSGNSDATTPGGERTVTGGFVQWKLNYASWAELISAVRYDNYRLSSNIGGTSGDRFSPKVTLGLLPTHVVTPYISYSEGYRAPSITETLVAGSHVASGPGQGDTAQCPDGSRGFFCFLPNPNLRPEVGKNKEIGLNVKKNDLFTAGDSFRGKFNVFQNDVTDFIDAIQFACPAPMGQCYQYQNIAAARIRGFEAETMYDANLWFLGVSGSFTEGKNTQTGIGLYSIPSQKITTTAGVRFDEGRVVASVMWTNVKGNTDIPANFLPATSYDLVNVYLSVKPTKNLTLIGSVENLLNQYYRPYAVPTGSDTTSTQNDVKWASAGAGIVFKGSLKYHFGG